MSLLGTILAALAVVLVGLGLVELAFSGPAASRPERGLRICLGAAIGLGVWSSAYAAVFVVFGGTSLAVMEKDAALALVGAGLCWRAVSLSAPDRRQPPLMPAPTPPLLSLLFVAAALIATTMFVVCTLRTPDGIWDAWAIWNLRAKFLLHNPHDLAAALSPQIEWAHPDYPLMLPGLVAQGWAITKHVGVAVPAVAAMTFATVCVGTLVCAVAVLRGAAVGLTAGLVLLGTPAFVKIAAYQIADVPVGTFALVAAVLAAIAVERSGSRATSLIMLAGAAASMAAWTKNEGMLHASALALAVFLFGGEVAEGLSPRLRRLGRFVAGAMPVVLVLTCFKLLYAPTNDLVHRTAPADILHRAMAVGRYATVAAALAWRSVQVNNWNCFWFALPLLVLLFRRTPGRQSAAKMIVVTCATTLLGFVAAYILTPYDLHWHIRTSMDRLLIQIWPSLVFAVFLAIDTRSHLAPPERRVSSHRE